MKETSESTVRNSIRFFLSNSSFSTDTHFFQSLQYLLIYRTSIKTSYATNVKIQRLYHYNSRVSDRHYSLIDCG